MILRDLPKIKRVITIVLIFALIIGAKLISRQYDAESLHVNDAESSHVIDAGTNKSSGRIYICERPVTPVASTESGNKSSFIASNPESVIRVIKHSELNHLFLILCFSVSLAITSSAAYFALAEAKQSCLVIAKSIQKKDGKK